MSLVVTKIFFSITQVYLPFFDSSALPWEGKGSKPSIKACFQCHFIHSMKYNFLMIYMLNILIVHLLHIFGYVDLQILSL